MVPSHLAKVPFHQLLKRKWCQVVWQTCRFFISQKVNLKMVLNLNNGRGSAVNRAPDGSTYPG